MKLGWTFKINISDINMRMDKNCGVQLDGIVKSDNDHSISKYFGIN
jgi:hypothetical protein